MMKRNNLQGFAVAALSALILLLLLATPQPVRAALTATALGDYDNVTVMEVSGNYDAVDAYGQVDMSGRREIAKEFYRTHGDDYDFLVIFTNFDFVLPTPQAIAFFSPAKNDISGIGLELYDYTNAYSATGAYLDRLEGTIDMSNASNLVLEPTDPQFEKTLQTLTHEMLHRWGAYVHYQDDSGESTAILGSDDAHWSFLLDSEGSTLYGNNWRDNGDGTFTSIPPEQGLDNSNFGRICNPLELYLMGLIDKSQVPPMTLIESTDADRTRIPELGVTVSGTAKTVAIDDIIAVEGARLPSAADARKEFRMAFIYAVIPGTWDENNAENRGEVASIGRLQTEWVKRFSILTDGSAMMQTDFILPETVETNPGVSTAIVNPAVAPSVNSGVAWLVSSQDAAGFWQDQVGTAQRDTASAVAALKPFAAGSASAADGQAWLAVMAADNSDFLARKLLCLDSAGLLELETLQNQDGGWGSAAGYRSNPVDTALALMALTKHGSSNLAVIDAAINYLHGRQNPDGGWNAGNGWSMVQPTAYALLALNGYRDNLTYALEPTVADGMSWLLGKQNIDGGFGNSPSTVIDTAAALSALKTAGAAQVATNEAVNYLLGNQDVSGSWNGSSFQTALAVEALYASQVAVDLTIASTDISFSPTTLDTVPGEITVAATVHNLGGSDASSAEVALYAGDPSLGNLVGRQSVDVPGNGSGSVSFATTVADFGLHPFHVVVDETDQLQESNEWNNSAYKTFAANMPPPTVGFELNESAGSEAQAAVALTVSLAYPWSEPITVSYSVNATSTALAGGDYLLSAGVLTFSPEETVKTVNLTVVNDLTAEVDKTVVVDLVNPSLGTLGTSQHTYTILDDEPPAVTISSPTAGVIGSNTPQLLYSTTGRSVEVRVDGVVVNKLSGDNLDPLIEGSHFVEVTATNSLGLDTTNRVDFTVDTTLPTVVITSPSSGVTNNVTPLLEYTTEHAVSVTVTVDGLVVNKVSGDTLGPLSDGIHEVRVEALNAAGSSGAASVTFTVNTQLPQVKIIYPDNDVIREATPTLFCDIDSSGEVQVWLNDVAVDVNIGEKLGPLVDGRYTLRVAVTAENGEVGLDETSFIVYSAEETAYLTAPGWPKYEPKNYGGIDVDSFGNVYMATQNSSYQLVVIKYAANGEQIWKQTPFSDTAIPQDLSVDSAGNVFVAGYLSVNSFDGFVYKFNGETGVFENGKMFSSAGSDYAFSVTVDSNDQVYVSGDTGGNLFSTANGTMNIWIAKLDNNCNLLTGRQLNKIGTQRLMRKNSIATDRFGNVYVAGYTDSATFGVSQGGDDAFVAKFTPDLSLTAPSFQFGTAGDDEAYDVTVDVYGNIYVVGTCGDAVYTSIQRGFLYKFSENGTYISNKTISTLVKSLSSESDGTVYVVDSTGIFYKYTSELLPLWSLSIGSYYNNKLVLDDFGNLYAAGDAGTLGNNAYVKKMIDSKCPSISFSESMIYTSESSILLAGAVDDGATVELNEGQYFRIGEVEYPTPGQWRMTIGGLTEGNNVVSVRATDIYGFQNEVSATVIVDIVSPVVTITSPGDGQTFSEKPVLEYNASEGSVTVYVNGIPTYKQSGAIIDALVSGMNKVKVEAVDSAGNIGFDEIAIFAENAAVGTLPMIAIEQTQYGSTGTETVIDIASDSVGNVYVFGYTTGSFSGYTNAGLRDPFIIKYDSSGNQLFIKQFGLAKDESEGGIDVDSDGNIYLAWTVHNEFYVKDTLVQDQEVHVAKFDSSGTLIWEQLLNSSGNDIAKCLKIDAAGNVYVAGETYGTLEKQKNGGLGDYFLSKFGNGGIKLWTRLSNESNEEYITDISVDAGGNVYAIGFVPRKDGIVSVYHESLLKYSSDGNFQWMVPLPLPSNEYWAQKVTQDYLGNIIIAGYRYGYQNYFISKHDTNGSLQWFESSTNPESWLSVYGVVTDHYGNIYLAGHGLGFEGNQSFGADDAILVMHNSSGEKLWSTQYGSSANDYVRGAVRTADGSIFVTGYTYGVLGDNQYGLSDVFLTKFVESELPSGPELRVNAVSSPTKLTTQYISGDVSPGSTLDVVVESPVSSTATTSSITLNADGAWAFSVSNLVPNVDNILVVSATDSIGTTSKSITITVDTLPPALTVNTVVSPTDVNSQVVSGTIDAGATLIVTRNSTGEDEAVPVTSGNWSYEATALAVGETILSFTATDVAGNSTVQTVTITYEPPPPLTLGISLVSINENESADIGLVVGNVSPQGATVAVEQSLDLNQNGLVEAGEPVVRCFVVTDGVAASNPNIPSDADGIANGSIETSLNGQFINDRYHAAGQYVFTVRTATDSDAEIFRVIEVGQPQSLSGIVRDGQGAVVTGALVELTDPWGRSYGFAMTDSAGRYRFNIERPGEYLPVPTAAGYVFDQTTAEVVFIAADQAAVKDLILGSGTRQVSGTVRDTTTTTGLSGVTVRAENEQYIATAMTGQDGNYSFLLPDGDYSLSVEPRPGDGLASLGYLGSLRPQLSVSVGSDISDRDLLVGLGSVQTCGAVTTAVGVGASGAPVVAVTADGSDLSSQAYSDADGNYCLSLSENNSWRIALDENAAHGIDLVGTTGTMDGPNLTAYQIDAWVTGIIGDEDGQPVSGVAVKVLHAVGATEKTTTVLDGRYLLGVSSEPAGNWDLLVSGETLGYESLEPIAVAAVQGQITTQNVTLLRAVEPVFVDINSVTTPTDQSTQTISGNRSTNATVTVTVNTTAVVGPMIYPTATTWQCLLSNLAQGDNIIEVTATDGVGQYIAPVVSIEYQPPVLVNSIEVTKATYDTRKKVLSVEATSLYENAQLQVDGYGPMTFSKLLKGKYIWTFSMGVATKPATVTVSGPEGSVTAAVL